MSKAGISDNLLNGGGEMGKRIREYDWSQTSIGTPDQWPQPLRTIVSVIIHSKFPMFLWWGNELIQFYNDAYRPSLGNDGKHPGALGEKAINTWPEIWPVIKPLIDQVLSGGEATWSENQLIPIYRNGQLENVYWTFCYSPVPDESGNPGGVLVTCTETTKTVEKFKLWEESQRQILASLEQSFIGIAVVKSDGFIIQSVNPLFCKLMGRTVEEMTARPVFDVIPELKNQGFEHLLQKVVDSGVPLIVKESPVTLIRNNRITTLYVDFTYQPQLDANGNITEVLVIVLDVTERVKSRIKLEAGESKLRNVIANAPASIALFAGPDFIIETPNQSFINNLGQGWEIENRSLREVLAPFAASETFIPVLDEVYRTGKMYESFGTPVNMMYDGVLSERYYNIIFQPLLDQAGKVYAILDISIDITEHFLAQQKLKETEVYLRRAMELAEIATWSIDAETNELFYSERLMNWLGTDPDTSDMMNIYPLILEPDRVRIQDAIEKAFANGADGFFDEECTIFNRQTGRQVYIHSIAKVICDDNGKPLRLVGTAQDITIQRNMQLALKQQIDIRTEELAAANEELHTTNEELSESNIQLLHSNDELAQYAYVASHDLQEPLRKIRIYSDMLSKDKNFPEDSRRTITKISNSAERMSLLIRDLLDFSRLLKADELIRRIDLNEVVSAVINDFELIIQEKNANIILEGLPVIDAIGLQMNQLFYNLLGNALKFTKPGVQPVIGIRSATLSSEEEKKYISRPTPDTTYFLINITDNGIGFETKYAEQIFDVFKRLHPKDVYAGSGIGLALCRRIVTNHQGHLYAVSEPGEGSSFHIILPYKQATL